MYGLELFKFWAYVDKARIIFTKLLNEYYETSGYTERCFRSAEELHRQRGGMTYSPLSSIRELSLTATPPRSKEGWSRGTFWENIRPLEKYSPLEN